MNNVKLNRTGKKSSLSNMIAAQMSTAATRSKMQWTRAESPINCCGQTLRGFKIRDVGAFVAVAYKNFLFVSPTVQIFFSLLSSLSQLDYLADHSHTFESGS
uniref:Uncharacterized protein n=1 Tax=Rhizophora mucronata TaxID=61149 RepID=A0A2P2NMS1_RHIMU